MTFEDLNKQATPDTWGPDWEDLDGLDRTDRRLIIHMKQHFAKVLQALEDMTGAMQVMWEALPDDATEEQEADFNGLNEAQQILKQAKEIK